MVRIVQKKNGRIWLEASHPGGSACLRLDNISASMKEALKKCMDYGESADVWAQQLNALAAWMHGLSRKKGWHDMPMSRDQFVERACNNLHDEVSELHEAWRGDRLDKPCDKAKKMAALDLPLLTALEEELADIAIRALENAAALEVDIGRAVSAKMAYNATRPYRHGNKRS